MPSMVLNRNHLLRTTLGVVSFEKGKPAWVTPNMVAAAVAIGADMVEGDTPHPLDLGEEQSGNQNEDVVLDAAELKSRMFAAFEQLVEKNDSADFTGAGVPTVKVVEKMLDVNITAKDVQQYWAEYKQFVAESQS